MENVSSPKSLQTIAQWQADRAPSIELLDRMVANQDWSMVIDVAVQLLRMDAHWLGQCTQAEHG